MEIIKTITVEMKLDTNEMQTLSNVCELARRLLETRKSGYNIAEFGENEAKNIRGFIAEIFQL